MTKLLFKNTIGKIYDDKIVVVKNKFSFDRIQEFDLFFYYDKRINIIFFSIGVLGSFMTVFFIKIKILLFFLLFFFAILFFMSMFYKRKQYFFKIVCDDNEIRIKIKMSDKEFAKKLIKEFWLIKKNGHS